MGLRISDILHRSPPVTIPHDATVAQLNGVLAEHRISGVPVVDDNGDVVGVASQTDIVRRIEKDLDHGLGFYTFPLVDVAKRAELGRDLAETPVSKIMERRVHSVTPNHDISMAARMLRNLRIHRLLVVEDRRPVGILTAHDLLAVLTSPELLARFWSSDASSDAPRG